MTDKAGTRVGAMSHTTKDEIFFFGYGVYEGDFVPDTMAGGFAELARGISKPNPRIRLDSGEVVWGGECWWGPEDKIKAQLDAYVAQGRKLVLVSIADAREKAKR